MRTACALLIGAAVPVGVGHAQSSGAVGGKPDTRRTSVSISLNVDHNETTRTTTYTDANGVTKITSVHINSRDLTSLDDIFPTAHQRTALTVGAAGARCLDIESKSGDISIERAATTGRVEVHADVTIRNLLAAAVNVKRYAGKFRVVTARVGGVLKGSTVAPKDFPTSLTFDTAYRIGLPAGMGLNARADYGQISVKGLGPTGAIIARSESGAIDITDSGATVDADTSGGAVTIHGARGVKAHSSFGDITIDDCLGAVSAASDGGKVVFSAPTSASIAIDAHTQSGKIAVDGVSGPVVVTGAYDRRFSGARNGGASPVTLNSAYGDITIKVR